MANLCMDPRSPSLIIVSTKSDGEPFKFTDQKAYDELSDDVTVYIANALVKEHGMMPIQIPIDKPDKPHSEVYTTPDIYTNDDTLLVILQGSGRVRPGIWGCALCINDSLKTGSMFSYIEKAKERNWAILIPNPNDRYDNSTGSLIEGCASHEEHTLYVWEHIVQKSPAKNIIVVAHSYGGVSMVELAKQHIDWLLPRVRGIAMTDSVHSSEVIFNSLSPEGIRFFASKATNWVRSTEPLDAYVADVTDSREFKKATKSVKQTARLELHMAGMAGRHTAVREVSAGTKNHSLTNASAIDSVFEYLDKNLE